MVYKHFQRKVYNGIYEALSARDYKLHESLGEIIDNSIANVFINENNKPEKVKVKININDEITIEDNGKGQDAKGLAESWSLGKPNNKKNSRFGVGLKQSAPGLGKTVILESKKQGEKHVHKFVFDKSNEEKIKLIQETPIEIEEIHISKTDYSIEEHFFKVTIKNLYRKYYSNTIVKTRELISSYFSSYLRNDEMDIYFQNKKIKPRKRPKLVYREDIESKKYGITGWWGITVKGEIGRTKKFGPDTFYNGRLTTQCDMDIIGQDSKHPNYYRMEAEINFDTPTIFDDNITSSKNNWVKNENYYEVKKWLEKNIRKKYMQKLKYVRKKEKNTEADKKIEIASKEFPKIVREIFPELRKKREDIGRATSNDVSTGESKFEVEERNSPKNKSDKNGETKDWDNNRKPNKKHKRIRPHAYIIIDGSKYYFKIIPVEYLDETYPRYASTINEKECVLEITINLNNPYVAHSKEENTDMFLINIGEWIIESILRYAMKLEDTEKFFEEREEKVGQVDWNELLNRIDLIYVEEKIEGKK